jgi:hypothetical protein
VVELLGSDGGTVGCVAGVWVLVLMKGSSHITAAEQQQVLLLVFKDGNNGTVMKDKRQKKKDSCLIRLEATMMQYNYMPSTHSAACDRIHGQHACDSISCLSGVPFSDERHHDLVGTPL